MTHILTQNRYGKSQVRLVKVTRDGDRHALRDLNVAIALEGEFHDAYTEGCNARVLPTDTMKNTVYALAKGHALESPEQFALDLARHFMNTVPHCTSAHVEIHERPWQRMQHEGESHPHAFLRPGEEQAFVQVNVDEEGATVRAGIRDLTVLKSTGSGFEGYLRDEYTTLQPTTDRILATSVTATWEYGTTRLDFNAAREKVRNAMLHAFATEYSPAVQQTIYVMGGAALDACPQLQEIHLVLPNKHHLLVDLSRFGMENDNEIFVATSDPFGLIEGTLRRAPTVPYAAVERLIRETAGGGNLAGAGGH